MTKPTCLNLRKLFGDRFKIRHEESYLAERPEFRQEEEVWLQIIPCQHGHIYPYGGTLLAWSSDNRGAVCKRVCRLPFVSIVQDGDDGVNLTFDACHFDQVAALVKPKQKPPKRVLTEAQRQAIIDRTAAYRFQRR